MLQVKVRKLGNSLGVVLPKKAIERLHTREGEELFLIESADGGYQLTPYDPKFEKKVSLSKNIIERYRNALHGLAK